MNTALAISHGRIAPCFAGVGLWIVQDNARVEVDAQTGLDDATVLSTQGWHPLGWGRALLRRDVGWLLCSGIDQSTWASVQGHGIQVIPNAMGEAEAVLAAWRRGQLSPPPEWPVHANGFNGFGVGAGGRGYGRRRFHGGQGSIKKKGR